jgi:predicted outer membrane repeat protein
LLLVVLAPALLASPALATTWIVPAGGAIQPVIDGSAPGDTVFITPSTTPYNQALTMPAWDITLTGTYGGTILDGAGLGVPVITFPSTIDSSNNTVVSNLTIQAGSAPQGGAIYLQGTSRPTLRNLRLTSNSAFDGGAIYLDLQGPPASPMMKMSRLLVQNNVAANGGGLYITGAAAASGLTPAVHVQLSHFDDNFALSSAGGGYGGGVFTTGYGGVPGVRFDHSWFDENGADIEGGAMFAWFDSRTLLHECTFHGNTAGSRGGGISVNGAALFEAANSTFDDDNCTQVPSEGGHLYMNAQGKSITDYFVENCLFVEGDAYNGGAISLGETVLHLLHSTLTSNHADPTFGIGGGLHLTGFASQSIVTDCIFWNDAAGQLDPSGIGDFEIATDSGALLPAVSFSDVQLASGSYPVPTGVTTPNLNANPQFATGYTCSWSPVGTAFLSASSPVSPCIDAGSMLFSASSIPAGWATNTAGTADAGQVDIGFHYPPTSCP